MDHKGKLMANILDRYFTDATPQELENIRIYGVKHPSEFAPDPTDEPAPRSLHLWREELSR